jgi:hypothetical protein
MKSTLLERVKIAAGEDGLQKSRLSNIIKGATDLVLLASAVLAVSLLVLIGSQNRQLREQLDLSSAEAYPMVGDYLPDVPATKLGVDVTSVTILKSTTLPTVIYFFSPDCKFCVAETGKLSSFASVAKSHGYGFVAVSTDHPNETRRMFPHPTSFPVLAENGGGIKHSYRVAGTPIYISLSTSRRVDAVHLGTMPQTMFATKLLR